VTQKPSPEEWSTSELPTERREYLDVDLSFEDIAARAVAEMEVTQNWIKRYKTPRKGEPKNAPQAIFRVQVSVQTSDLLWNACDGLRGRYWQGPESGDEANKNLISLLQPELLAFAEKRKPSVCKGAADMTLEDITASLQAPSAKIWPIERGDDGGPLLGPQRLAVSRWEINEEHDCCNRGMWRRTPLTGLWEIKGGILGVDRIEYVPQCKRDRSRQIHKFGFT
jgi:hypothetical protein